MSNRTREALIAVLVAAAIAGLQEVIKYLGHLAIPTDTQTVSSAGAGLTYFVRMVKYI